MTAAPTDRRLAAILSADVVGYSRLMAADEAAKSRYVSPVVVAIACAEAGETDLAFDWLERAYRERDPVMISLKAFPPFDPLRSDPRFDDLLRRIGFPES